ncbi:MAG TPA: LysR substrate-binding domain-containing protein [Acidimicrobiales bacterium]|nr:LysR substrate-binding domain-containing protein [Acidimicrobiales bacterium]
MLVAPAPASNARRSRRVTLEDSPSATWLLREPGSGTRGTTEELLRELELAPAVLTVGSNGAILESVEMGLGIALISGDAAASQLESGALEEWRHGRLPLRREWHLVGRAGEDLVPTARLMLEHLGTQGGRAPVANGAKPG